MFYSHQILAKKGPLGTIWIAAHMDRKLRKNQVFETSISSSVDTILAPQMPLALRLSGQLLLGVVRIYSRQVNYLFTDCSEALIKFKQVMRPGVGLIELPAETSTAPFNAVTLPEHYDDLHLASNKSSASRVDANISKRADITLQEAPHGEDLGSATLMEERFGVMDGESYIELEELDAEDEYARDVAASKDGAGPMLLDEYDLGDVEPPTGLALDGGDDTLELLDMDELLNEAAEEAASDPAREDAANASMQGVDGFESMIDIEVETFRDASAPGVEVPTPLATPNANYTPGSQKVPPAAPAMLTPLQVALGMSTPRSYNTRASLNSDWTRRSSARLPTPDLNDDGFDIRVAKETPSTAQRGQREAVVRRRRLVTDSHMIKSNDEIRNQLRSTGDIVRARPPPHLAFGVALRLAEFADPRQLINPAVGLDLCQPLHSLYEQGLDLSGIPLLPWSVSVKAVHAHTPAANMNDVDDENRHQNGQSVPQNGQATPRSSGQKRTRAGREITNQSGPTPAYASTPVVGADGADGAGLVSPAEGFAPTPLAYEEAPDDLLSTMHNARDSDQFASMPDLSFDLNDNHTPSNDDAAGDKDEDLEERRAQRLARVGGMSLGDALHVGDGAVGAEDAAQTEQPTPDPEASTGEEKESGPPEGAWSQRTRSVLTFMQAQFEVRHQSKGKQADLRAYELLEGQTPREAARMFFELLLLNNKGYVTLKQAKPFGDISVFATSRTLSI